MRPPIDATTGEPLDLSPHRKVRIVQLGASPPCKCARDVLDSADRALEAAIEAKHPGVVVEFVGRATPTDEEAQP